MVTRRQIEQALDPDAPCSSSATDPQDTLLTAMRRFGAQPSARIVESFGAERFARGWLARLEARSSRGCLPSGWTLQLAWEHYAQSLFNIFAGESWQQRAVREAFRRVHVEVTTTAAAASARATLQRLETAGNVYSWMGRWSGYYQPAGRGRGQTFRYPEEANVPIAVWPVALWLTARWVKIVRPSGATGPASHLEAAGWAPPRSGNPDYVQSYGTEASAISAGERFFEACARLYVQQLGYLRDRVVRYLLGGTEFASTSAARGQVIDLGPGERDELRRRVDAWANLYGKGLPQYGSTYWCRRTHTQRMVGICNLVTSFTGGRRPESGQLLDACINDYGGSQVPVMYSWF
jgi:hypothetical protein